jgi:histidine decarboxylase
MASEPTPPIAAADLDPATRAELDQLLASLMGARTTNIGFPAAADFDPSPLIPFLRLMLNNLGDPTVDGDYPHHTKAQERDVVGVIADLLRAPSDDRWGYVTSGASEGTEQALLLARSMYPDAVVYHSVAAHHCVPHAVARLAMPAVTVRAKEHGEVDYDDLTAQIERHRDRPIVLVANIGTAMSEAVDDVRRLTDILDQLAVTRRWVHADAALSGIPLALLDPGDRPGFDFLVGADSVIVSGHKFLGAPRAVRGTRGPRQSPPLPRPRRHLHRGTGQHADQLA